MARSDLRPIIKLRSTAGTGYTYVTRKNRRNDPDAWCCAGTTPSFDGTSNSARQCNIVKNARRQEIVARYAERRAELKRVIASPARTDDERETRAAQ